MAPQTGLHDAVVSNSPASWRRRDGADDPDPTAFGWAQYGIHLAGWCGRAADHRAVAKRIDDRDIGRGLARPLRRPIRRPSFGSCACGVIRSVLSLDRAQTCPDG